MTSRTGDSDLTRSELRDDIHIELAAFGGMDVTDSEVQGLTETLLSIVDRHVGTQRRAALLWAADECRREARWLLEKRRYEGSTAAGKLEGVIRNAAVIDEYVRRGETP